VTTLVSFACGLALAVVWGTSLGLAFAAVGVYVRDAVLAAPILTLGMIFISPLYLDPASGGLAGFLVRLNPLTLSMEFILKGLSTVAQSPVEIVLGVAGAIVSLWFASALFRRMSSGFADYV
jgi:ABC-2 type transporter.